MKIKNKVGRPAGSNSFIKVPMGDLIKFINPERNVLISRKFAELLKIKGESILPLPKKLKKWLAEVLRMLV